MDKYDTSQHNEITYHYINEQSKEKNKYSFDFHEKFLKIISPLMSDVKVKVGYFYSKFVNFSMLAIGQ